MIQFLSCNSNSQNFERDQPNTFIVFLRVYNALILCRKLSNRKRWGLSRKSVKCYNITKWMKISPIFIWFISLSFLSLFSVIIIAQHQKTINRPVSSHEYTVLSSMLCMRIRTCKNSCQCFRIITKNFLIALFRFRKKSCTMNLFYFIFWFLWFATDCLNFHYHSSTIHTFRCLHLTSMSSN